MQETVDTLKRSVLLRGLPETLLNELSASSEARRWQAGEIIRGEQSEDNEILLLADGEARSDILLCNADQNLSFTISRVGDLLGLYHFIEPGKHPFTVTAQTDVRVLVWQADAFRRTMESDTEAAYKTAVYTARLLYRQALHLSAYLFDNICWGLP